MHRILYLILKEFRQILREHVFLGLIFGVPFIQIVILGFAITMDVKNVTLGIVDEDHSAMSRRLTEAFSVTESFNYLGAVASGREAIRLMDDNKIKMVIIIPYHFERDLKQGLKPKVQALVDGVDGNSAGVALAYANQIAFKMQKEWIDKNSLKDVHLSGIETRMLYNPGLASVNNIVPGILAILIVVITSFLTGMSIVREKELGTLEQLMVTPIRKGELMLGKVLPLAVVGFLLFNVGMLAAGLIFGLWIKGNIFSLYAMVFLFMLTTLGIGIFTSTIVQTQQQAMFFTWFFMIFATLLSGFFIPIENMPKLIQMITYLNPVRYFMVVIREIYLKGTEFHFLWKEALAMLVFGGLTILGATVRFRKRVG